MQHSKGQVKAAAAGGRLGHCDTSYELWPEFWTCRRHGSELIEREAKVAVEPGRIISFGRGVMRYRMEKKFVGWKLCLLSSTDMPICATSSDMAHTFSKAPPLVGNVVLEHIFSI